MVVATLAGVILLLMAIQRGQLVPAPWCRQPS